MIVLYANESSYCGRFQQSHPVGTQYTVSSTTRRIGKSLCGLQGPPCPPHQNGRTVSPIRLEGLFPPQAQGHSWYQYYPPIVLLEECFARQTFKKKPQVSVVHREMLG